ncbi:MAG: hypothetical protein Tsb009_34920 [Planctomycetaceae bacterium]
MTSYSISLSHIQFKGTFMTITHWLDSFFSRVPLLAGPAVRSPFRKSARRPARSRFHRRRYARFSSETIAGIERLEDRTLLTTVDLFAMGLTAQEHDGVTGPVDGYFQLSRDDSVGDLTVYYQVEVTSTAESGVDYVALTGLAVIPDGNIDAAIAVAPIDDLLVEGDETVTVTLLSDPGYTLGFSTSDTVTIESDDILYSPTVTGPPSPTTDTTPLVTWDEPATPATSYDMEVYNVDIGQLVYSVSGLTGTQHEVTTSLNPMDQYEVYMRSVNSFGQTSNWEMPYIFDLEFPAVNITGPSTPTADTTPLATWDAIDDANTYNLQLYSYPLGQMIVNEVGITGTSYHFSTPLAYDNYELYVQPVNATGEAGIWNNPHYFDVVTAAPIAVDDVEYSTTDTLILNVSMAEGVLANDYDENGDILLASLLSGPTYGTVVLNPDGSFAYTPFDDGFYGYDTFYYTASDGVLTSAPAEVKIARNQIIIENGEPKPNYFDLLSAAQSPEDLYTFAEVDPTVTIDRWIGEIVGLQTKIKGPKPPAVTSYQWTVPGKDIAGYKVAADVSSGHVIPMEAWRYQNYGLEFYWTEPSLPYFVVTVDVTLAGGGVIHKSARFRVNTPLISVFAETGNTHWIPPNANNVFLFTSYQYGSDIGTDAPGIRVDANILDGLEGGQLKWVQLINSWEARAYFPKAPGIAANPNVGPGEYIISQSGYDGGAVPKYPIMTGNVFTDLPSIRVPVWTAGQGGTLTHAASFSTYLLWQSPRSGSIAAPLRKVDWTWSFDALTREVPGMPGTWEWGPQYDSSQSTTGGAVITDFPEWDRAVIPTGNSWVPLG